MLRWREQTARLDPLTRSVFWTYAGYILGTNVFFGAVSALAPSWLTDGSPLARAVCGFISLYWGMRIVIQLFVFARHRPAGNHYRLAEAAMGALFVYLTAVYGGVALALF